MLVCIVPMVDKHNIIAAAREEHCLIFCHHHTAAGLGQVVCVRCVCLRERGGGAADCSAVEMQLAAMTGL